MLKVTVKNDQVRVGKRFSVAFQRTLRVPQDGQVYPLPPALGRLPILPVEQVSERVPKEWCERGGVVIPLYQREALWLGFGGASWKPNAVQVAVGGINAVSGEDWSEGLSASPQNYIVCPDQPWLDGINAGAGYVRQFVAMPLGSGRTVEGQLTGHETFGGIQIRVYEPKLGRFPDRPPRLSQPPPTRFASPDVSGAMGIGAGGKLKQKIYPDRYGLEVWDEYNFGIVLVHIVNSEQYQELTGRLPPPSPISAKTYSEYGLPWFDLYDEEQKDVAASELLARVEPVGAEDNGPDQPIEIPREQIKKILRRRPRREH